MITMEMPLRRDAMRHRVRPGSAGDKENVGQIERWLSLAGGSLLALEGMRRGEAEGLALAAAGAGLIYRGASGYCPLYRVLGVSTKKHGRVAAVAAGSGVKIDRAITVNRPAAELFERWRNYQKLPEIMSHLVSVEAQGDSWRWTAKAPAGTSVAWDAEVINEEPNHLIAWRSFQGSQVATAGSVHFTQLPGERGTLVRVVLKYDPPGGTLGSWLAWLFGQEPNQQIAEDLRRFKQIMEAGEVPVA